MNPELAFAPVTELGQRLRKGEFTSLQLTEFFLDRLKQFGPTYNAVVTRTDDLARQAAQQADEERRAGQDRGPLHGIPYGVKDLLATKGIPTSWGAAPLKDQIIDSDATVIQKLRAAGGVLVAKLAMVELAGGFGYRQANCTFTGPGRNAWNRDRWAGGSSSGPGSAVGAGLVPFAIGSETSGSIITPACYNGLSGLRPTYGRVSRHGAMALSWSLDKIGPMCRTVEDAATVFAAIAGPDEADPTVHGGPYQIATVSPSRRFRCLVLSGAEEQIQEAVKANYRQSLKMLGEMADIQETTLPDLPYGAVVSTIIACEMAAAFEELIRSGQVWELTAPEDRWGGHSGLVIPAKDYINAQRVRTRIQQAMNACLRGYDAIVTPTLTTVAGPIDTEFRHWPKGFSSTPIGTAGNAAGLPALTLANGFDEDGLPTGLLLTGKPHDEATLFALGQRLQQVTNWHTRHPPVG